MLSLQFPFSQLTEIKTVVSFVFTVYVYDQSDESCTILPLTLPPLYPSFLVTSGSSGSSGSDRRVFQHNLWCGLPGQLDRGHNTGKIRNTDGSN